MNIVLATLNAKYIHTNLALRLLKAYCAEEFPVKIVEYTIKDPLLNVVTDLYGRKPDVLGFSCYIWNTEETIQIAKMLKKINPELIVVFGGPEVSYDADYWLKRVPELDFVIMGEGEGPFLQLLRELDGAKQFERVDGLAYRKGSADDLTSQEELVCLNPPALKINLDDIPTPYRFLEDAKELSSRIVYFETSRGCPFHCQFCLSSIETGVRYFDIERTKADILYLVAAGAKQIKFVDRTFNIKREYALEMFAFLIENHGGCIFQFEITADIMRPEVLDFLAEYAPSGIFRFEIGIQSTNERTNELVKRKQNFAKLSRTVNAVKATGRIDLHLDLIAGLPEEDYESFRKTFNDVFDMRPEELQLGFLKMLRGTGMRRDAGKYGYIYMENAPYEILGNPILPFADIVRIKRLEDMLEKYWNDHRTDRTVDYLIAREFATPFDFFQELGDYTESQGWAKTGYQLEDLFSRLHTFLINRHMPNFHVVEGLLKLDYFLNHKYKPRKIWWDFSLSKSEHSDLVRYAAEYPDHFISRAEPGLHSLTEHKLTERELHKHGVVEMLPFDLARYEQEGVIDLERDTLLLVYYPPAGGTAEYFTATLERPFLQKQETLRFTT
ncbi:MAG: B12-binding domain-containing radical SAM protein [Gorillibacterium sp.]|nr:B12-binding domain-containing radical SAM protein [Gorillibacterium sp.]